MPYNDAAKRKARRYLARVRARTVCSKCGGRPIEFHNEEHEKDSNRRVAHLAALGFPVQVIAAEISRCEALCRSCHMKLDGRLAALLAARPRQAGMVFPAKRCTRCGKRYKPLRRGLCNACNHRQRARKGGAK